MCRDGVPDGRGLGPHTSATHVWARSGAGESRSHRRTRMHAACFTLHRQRFVDGSHEKPHKLFSLKLIIPVLLSQGLFLKLNK